MYILFTQTDSHTHTHTRMERERERERQREREREREREMYILANRQPLFCSLPASPHEYIYMCAHNTYVCPATTLCVRADLQWCVRSIDVHNTDTLICVSGIPRCVLILLYVCVHKHRHRQTQTQAQTHRHRHTDT